MGGSVGTAGGSRQTQGQQHSSKSFKYKLGSLLCCTVLSSRVVVVGGTVVVVCLSFFFPFLSVLGFLVALGSLFFFLSFFFFLPSSGALLTLPNKPGKRRKTGEERGFYITRISIHAQVVVFPKISQHKPNQPPNWIQNEPSSAVIIIFFKWWRSTFSQQVNIFPIPIWCQIVNRWFLLRTEVKTPSLCNSDSYFCCISIISSLQSQNSVMPGKIQTARCISVVAWGPSVFPSEVVWSSEALHGKHFSFFPLVVLHQPQLSFL